MTENHPLNPERPRGILSKSERRYYTGNLEATGQKKRNIRAGAREHLKHSLLDMVVIEKYMQDKDLESVLYDLAEPLDSEEESSINEHSLPIDDAMESMISIIYYYYDTPDMFTNIVSRGVRKQINTDELTYEVNVEIDIEQNNELEYLEELLNTHGPDRLTYIQLATLHEAGKITTEEHKEYLSEKSEDE
jgi:hypothetical protein